MTTVKTAMITTAMTPMTTATIFEESSLNSTGGELSLTEKKIRG